MEHKTSHSEDWQKANASGCLAKMAPKNEAFFCKKKKKRTLLMLTVFWHCLSQLASVEWIALRKCHTGTGANRKLNCAPLFCSMFKLTINSAENQVSILHFNWRFSPGPYFRFGFFPSKSVYGTALVYKFILNVLFN